MTAPTPTAFTGKVRKQMIAISFEQALEQASAAGFKQTSRSRAGEAHVQRSWNVGAKIRPVPGGVVVQPAWTSGQIWAVVGILMFFALFTVCPGGSALVGA